MNSMRPIFALADANSFYASAETVFRPDLRGKQGMWILFGEHGQVLKRGHELANVLAPLERRLVKAVDG